MSINSESSHRSPLLGNVARSASVVDEPPVARDRRDRRRAISNSRCDEEDGDENDKCDDGPLRREGIVIVIVIVIIIMTMTMSEWRRMRRRRS